MRTWGGTVPAGLIDESILILLSIAIFLLLVFTLLPMKKWWIRLILSIIYILILLSLLPTY